MHGPFSLGSAAAPDRLRTQQRRDQRWRKTPLFSAEGQRSATVNTPETTASGPPQPRDRNAWSGCSEIEGVPGSETNLIARGPCASAIVRRCCPSLGAGVHDASVGRTRATVREAHSLAWTAETDGRMHRRRPSDLDPRAGERSRPGAPDVSRSCGRAPRGARRCHRTSGQRQLLRCGAGRGAAAHVAPVGGDPVVWPAMTEPRCECHASAAIAAIAYIATASASPANTSEA